MLWRQKVNFMTMGSTNYGSVGRSIMSVSLNPSLTGLRSHLALNAVRLERSVVL
jgi:hypothetical protein